MTKTPYVVVFAGAQGSSKSIVAHFLSMEFSLPILNRDIIRSEVKEDLFTDDISEGPALKEFEKRFTDRWQKTLKNGRSFILDGSVDRRWGETKKDLEAAGYRWFMIDMELSRSFFEDLFKATKRQKAIGELDRYLADHKKFMRAHGDDVTIKITDDTFGKRVHEAAEGLRSFLRA